jgi:DNA-binding LacI/PurR family transcriptional regulator
MRIQDIAALAGVSAATVSRVFSNHPNISQDVREQVLALAKKHGYHPRLSVRRRNVVVITPSRVSAPTENYSGMVLTELARELSARDFRIEILPADNIDRLASIQFCGVVTVGIDETFAQGWDKRFAAPLVVVDRQIPSFRNVYAVHSDERQGMELALEHLIAAGRQRIGCLIYHWPGISNSLLRQEAIVAILEKHDMPCDESLVRLLGPDGYIEETGKLLQAGVDALFCPGGNGGIVTAYALSLYGRSIGAEISLLSSERMMVSRYCVPSQSTITQDYPALASAVVDVIQARMEGQQCPQDIILPYKLIERDSVRRRL